MRIVVDAQLCEGNGLCQELAPDVFAVDDDDTLHVLQHRPAEGLREQVEQAEQTCPRGAIKVLD